MQSSEQPENFRPWLSNLIWVFYGLVILAMAFYFLFQRGYVTEFLVAFALCSGFIVYQWKQFMRRSFGKRLETKALKRLEEALKHVEGSEFASSVLLPGQGDADAVVKLRGVKFNLEIKAIQDPQKVTKAHAKQAMNAARVLFTIPVVWLPSSKLCQGRDRHGVNVFCGDEKSLIRYLGSLS